MGMRTSVCLLLGLATAMAPAKADPIKTSGGLVSAGALLVGPLSKRFGCRISACRPRRELGLYQTV
jgi:hypothetical protein